MAQRIEIPILAGLSIGIGFIIILAIGIPFFAISSGNVLQNSESDSRSMPASFYLNACELPANDRAMSTGKEFDERTWISVVRIDRAFGVGAPPGVPCTILTSELVYKIPVLADAIQGADGCIDGTEICQVSSGISRGGDELDYEMTITKDDAARILSEFKLGPDNAAILASGNRFYTLWFYNYDRDAAIFEGAQVEASFLDYHPSIMPIPLAAGQSVNFTMLVKAYATYGGPVTVDLLSTSSARDSGLLVEFEPATLEMEERTEARVTLRITATENVREGTYDIGAGGKINNYGYIPSGPCNYSCPVIKVGNSNWHIQTFGNDTQMAQYGLGTAPDWLRLDIETDKETYSAGEPIEVKAFLVNKGPQRLIIDGTEANRRMMTMIGGPVGENFASVYGIDAYDYQNDSNPIVVEPYSKKLLVRSFLWDQKTFRSDSKPEQVPYGNYNIVVSFAGYGNVVLNGHHEIRIFPLNQSEETR